jgi:hypothetical protein
MTQLEPSWMRVLLIEFPNSLRNSYTLIYDGIVKRRLVMQVKTVDMNDETSFGLQGLCQIALIASFLDVRH